MWQYVLVIAILIQAVNLAQLTHYEVLGVSRDASQQEIRTAYKKLAIKFHPDKNPEAEQQKQFLRVSEAYETLRDARRRRLYDGWGGLDPQDMQRGLYYDDPFVVTLTGHDYDSRIAEGLHFVNFYSPACPPCRRLATTWSRLAELYADVVHFSAVNCRAQAHFCHHVMRVPGYPTLLLYTKGRSGSYMYYNGGLEPAALERFVINVVADRAPAPPAPLVAQPVATPDTPVLYVLASWRMEDGAPNRLAYRLRGVAKVYVVEDDELRSKLSSNEDTTCVLQLGDTRIPLTASERDLPRAVAEALPPPPQLGPDDIKEIRSSLRSGAGRAHALRLRGSNADPLEFWRLRADLPELDFAEVDCTRWDGLCSALQAPGGGRWAVLKVGGAYQVTPPLATPSDPAGFLKRAARLQNLQSLSETEYSRILEGESSSMWLVGVGRGAALLDHFLTAAENYQHRDDLQLGLLQCPPKPLHSGPCSSTTNLVLMQRGKRRHQLPAPADTDDVLTFLDLLMDDSVEYLTEESAMDISRSSKEATVSWLVAWLPYSCSPQCARAAHRWRELARMFRPLASVRVGMVQCGEGGGVCGNVRSPSARLYNGGDSQVYGTNLLDLGETWRTAQWAAEMLRAPVTTLHEVPSTRDATPWLVYFHSPRCHRCHELYPDFAVASLVLAGRVKAGRINCLEARGLCQRERITSYPSMKLYTRGSVAELYAGPAVKILKSVEPMLSKHRHDEF